MLIPLLGGYTKAKLTDALDHSKTLKFNFLGLVDDIAIFTTPPLVCYCSLDLSSRRTASRVKVHQALTSSLVVHLADSTTLTAQI